MPRLLEPKQATAIPSLTVNICKARTSLAEMAEPTRRVVSSPVVGVVDVVAVAAVVGVVLIPLVCCVREAPVNAGQWQPGP